MATKNRANNKRRCCLDDCNEPHSANGYCNKHHIRVLKYGDPYFVKVNQVRKRNPICAIDGCGKPHSGLGYCAMHYRRYKKNGNPDLVKMKYEFRDPICLAKGCDRNQIARGYCTLHVQRFYKYKNPEFKNNISYDSNNVTYLYKLFDMNKNLLYIGITINTKQRFREHSRKKEWWSSVAIREVVKFSSRYEAAMAEIDLIEKENPIYNIKRRRVQNEN